MRRVGRSLLGAYLGLFAVWARDGRHVREEQRLLGGSIEYTYGRLRDIGSIEYTYGRLRDIGRGPGAALALSLWSHLGQLQPVALIAKVRADDQRAAREGVGGRRAATRVAALGALVATGALFIWGSDALGWIFWPLLGVMFAIAVWSARRRGARWLILLATLLMIWPFLGLRMGFETTFVVSLLLAATLAAHRGWQSGRGSTLPWANIVLLASMPLWWSAGVWLHGPVRSFLLTGGGAGTGGRFGLPRDETSMALGIAMGVMVVCYWALVALVISNTATELRGRSVEGEGEDGVETVWL